MRIVIPAPVTCGTGAFSCTNGRCIDSTLLCNHVDDCGDMSDEEPCKFPETYTSSKPCNRDEFTCSLFGNRSVCVPLTAK